MERFCNALKLKSVIFKSTARTLTDFNCVLNGVELIAFNTMKNCLQTLFLEKAFLPAVIIIPKCKEQTQPKGD